MRHDKHEPEAEPIISDAAARFTVVLFLALFTIGAALFIWRGLSPVPEGDHWIDQVMGAIRAFSTFAAMLLIPVPSLRCKGLQRADRGPIETSLPTWVGGGLGTGCSAIWAGSHPRVEGLDRVEGVG